MGTVADKIKNIELNSAGCQSVPAFFIKWLYKKRVSKRKERFMRVAAIDVGTNSVRLLKGEIRNGILYVGNKKLKTTRLGEDVDKNKKLLQKSMERTAKAIISFSEESKAWGAKEVLISATSAVRDAKNQEHFLQIVKETSGLKIEVVSGEKEAHLGFSGVLSGMDTQVETILVIDVGGGSTELIVGGENGIIFAKSINVGAVRMSEKYGKKGQFSLKNWEALLEDIKKELNPLLPKLKSFSFEKFIGIGGTATSFGAMDKKMAVYNRAILQNHKVSLENLHSTNNYLKSLSINQRKEMVGLQPQRADIIVAGGAVIEVVMKVLSLDCMIVSDFDNLEGQLVQAYGDQFSHGIKVEKVL